MGESLIYMSSEHILRYITKHPINWMSDRQALGDLGGAGDKAGLPPVPSVELWIQCLKQREQLFTQHEYMEFAFDNPEWKRWLAYQPSQQIEGVKVKLFKNFYPSMIDSLHVWAILVETGLFDSCIIETDKDAISKIDMIVRTNGREIPLAIMGPSSKARYAKWYKDTYRSNGSRVKPISLQLSIRKPRVPGNKRWFDKEEVITTILCHDLNKPSYESGIMAKNTRGICPVCNMPTSRKGATCGSVRCTSLWTIHKIPEYYWRAALNEMLTFSPEEESAPLGAI